MWIAAYFSGRRGGVAIGADEGEVPYETGLSDFVFDVLLYVDLLLGALGVVGAYGLRDYGGVVGGLVEWVERMEGEGGGEK